MVIYTIGYGNRPITDFVELLRKYSITCLVDVRSLPTSRFRPDYRQKALRAHLEAADIAYWWAGEALGGKLVDPSCLVDGKIDMERLAALPAFRDAVDAVAAAAAREAAAAAEEAADAVGPKFLVLMCAELRPKDCHRVWMLAPQMEARGLQVRHIDENGALKTQQEV